jgi:hypothetical protein
VVVHDEVGEDLLRVPREERAEIRVDVEPDPGDFVRTVAFLIPVTRSATASLAKAVVEHTLERS